MPHNTSSTLADQEKPSHSSKKQSCKHYYYCHHCFLRYCWRILWGMVNKQSSGGNICIFWHKPNFFIWLYRLNFPNTFAIYHLLFVTYLFYLGHEVSAIYQISDFMNPAKITTAISLISLVASNHSWKLRTLLHSICFVVYLWNLCHFLKHYTYKTVKMM